MRSFLAEALEEMSEEIISNRLLGAGLSQKKAESIGKIGPLPSLGENVTSDLLDKEQPLKLRRRRAGATVLAWLKKQGRFVRSEDDELFYFYEKERRLYGLEGQRWGAFLQGVTKVNQADPDFPYIDIDCQAEALGAPSRPVVKVAYWDETKKALWVSRFDGTVYCLDGKTRKEEYNGKSVLFHDEPEWEPYNPVAGGKSALSCFSPNWEGSPEVNGVALRVWVLSTFFTELCPTRPLLVLLGERGSGKTTTIRLILRLLFGFNQDVDVNGLPDKQDGFTAAASHHHVLCLDNLDQFTPWLRDKLARLCTGGVDEIRRLYTNNEVGRIHYRVWMAITARTPDTLRRDDLADRALLLSLKRMEGGWEAETKLLNEAQSIRNEWWGAVLQTLNEVVAAIRKGGLSGLSPLRLADWEILGRLIAKCLGSEAAWSEFVKLLKEEQGDFLLDNPIVDCIESWLKQPANWKREISTGDLYGELTLLKPLTGLPRNSAVFGRELTQLQEPLERKFGMKLRTGRSGTRFCLFENGDDGEGKDPS